MSKAKYIRIRTPDGRRLTTIKMVLTYLENHGIPFHARDVRRYIERLLRDQFLAHNNIDKDDCTRIVTTNQFINATLGRRDQYAQTPKQVFDFIHKTFGYPSTDLFDPCPASPTFDGCASSTRWKRIVYVNPPYKEIDNWLEKGMEELVHDTEQILYLLPSRTNPAWFHKYVMHASHIIFFENGIQFENYKYKCPFGIMLVNFRREDLAKKHPPKICSAKLF